MSTVPEPCDSLEAENGQHYYDRWGVCENQDCRYENAELAAEAARDAFG